MILPTEAHPETYLGLHTEGGLMSVDELHANMANMSRLGGDIRLEDGMVVEL